MTQPRIKLGQPSWKLTSDRLEAWLTVLGGHLGPAWFILNPASTRINPLSVAPWAQENVAEDTPQIIRSLRGDFFCLPFGGNAKSFRGEKHPEDRGYSFLKPGTTVTNLENVHTVFGINADLSRFPARRRFEDIVINVNDPRNQIRWTAVVLPKLRYVWFALKYPRALTSTL